MGGDLKSAIAERNFAFENDDLTWAARLMPNASSPRVVEMAFHKARLDCVAISETKRRESQLWLAQRGLGDMLGRRVIAGTPLPR